MNDIESAVFNVVLDLKYTVLRCHYIRKKLQVR